MANEEEVELAAKAGEGIVSDMARQGFKKADEGVADAAGTTAKDLAQDATRQNPPDKLFAAANRDVDLDRITPKDYVWRTNDRPLIRVDDQDPAHVFEHGFQPKDVDGDYDLNNKVAENNPGPFVSTSYANDFGDNFPYRYDVDAPGGIDFNASTSVRANEGEEEVAFPGGVAPQFIKGAQEFDEFGNPVGDYITNPNYRPWTYP